MKLVYLPQKSIFLSIALIFDLLLININHQKIRMNAPREERIFQPSLFREYLRSKIISLLDSIAGRKLLVLESAARIPINLIIEKKQLLQHEIPEDGGIMPFQVVPIDVNFDQIVVILSPTVENLRKLKDLITINIQRGSRKFYPVFWPKRTLATKQFLQTSNLNPYIEIRDFSFDLLPLDTDLYSLEMKILRDLYIDDNHSIYTTIAESIHRIQSVFGKIHNVFCKGKGARSIFEILKLKQQEIKVDQTYGDIEHLIILDRACDFVTPLIKQTTYEGMIDEFYGINGGIAKIPSTEGSRNQKTEQVMLNSEKDFIFQEIRILNILKGVQGILKRRSAEHDEFNTHAKQIKDINEKAAAVKRIQTQQRLLKKHINIKSVLMEEMKTIGFHKELILQQECLQEGSNDIVEYFENLIPFEVPLEKILRSMCLQSIIDKGIHRKFYHRICEDIAMTYGGEQIISLSNLAKLGLFYEKGSKRQPYPFAEIKKELKLISNEPINHESPNDPSFAYGGYCPILTKLVDHAIRNGWRSAQKALKLIPGDTIWPDPVKQCTSHPRPAVIIYFVGGVTFGEIATIRLLSRFFKKQFIIATTHIINGDNMIESLLEKKS